MKVVKKTGLVPVHSKHEKKVFGVKPAIAVKGVADGTLFLAEVPEGVETFEFAVSEPVKVESPVEVDGVVQIPDDWESKHYATQIVLARTLAGGELPVVEDQKPVEVAREIIRDELARRAAAGAAANITAE